MAKFNHIDVRGTKKVPSAFGNVFICSGSVTDAKTVVFPDGYLNGATPEPNLAFKAVFPNGHNAANASSYLSLNGVVVVSNQNGTLAPIPIHAMTEGGSTVYKVLQANTVLDLYYTADYDGNSTPAWVVIGNPIVLSSSNYSIYADGSMIDNRISSGTATPTAYCASHLDLGWHRVNTNVIQVSLYLEVTGITGSQTGIIATGFPKPRMGFDTPRFLTWWGTRKTSIIVYIDSQGNLHAIREDGAGTGNVSLTASFYYI